MSGFPIRGGLRLYNVSSGTLLASTENVEVATWADEFDVVGNIVVSIPATDPAAAYFDDGAGAIVLARLFVSDHDYQAQTGWVTQWIVRDVQIQITEGDWVKTDTGNHLFDEWNRATTLHAIYNFLTLQQILKVGAVGVNADGTGAQVLNEQGLLTVPATLVGSGISGGLGFSASIATVMIGSSIRFVVDANFDTRLRALTTLLARAGGKSYPSDTLPDGSRGHWYANPRTQVLAIGQIGTDNGLVLRGGQGLTVGDPSLYTDSLGYIESITPVSVQDQVANRIYPMGGRSDSGLPESGFAATGLVRMAGQQGPQPYLAIHLGDQNGGVYTTLDGENFTLAGLQNHGVTSLSYVGDTDATHFGALYASTSTGIYKRPGGAVGTAPKFVKVGGLRARCARVVYDVPSSTIWALVRGESKEMDGIWRSPVLGSDAGLLADPSAGLTPLWSKVVSPGNARAIEDMVPGGSTRVYFLDTTDPTKLYRWNQGSTPQISTYSLAGVTTAKALTVTSDYIFIHTSEGMKRLNLGTTTIEDADPFGNLPVDTYTVYEESGKFWCGTTNGIYAWDGNTSDGSSTYWYNIQNAGNCCQGIGSIAARYMLIESTQPLWLAADASRIFSSGNQRTPPNNTGGQVWLDLQQQRVSLAAQFMLGTVALHLPSSPDISDQTFLPGYGPNAPAIKRIYGPQFEYVYYVEDATSQGSFGVIDLPDQSQDLATSLYMNYSQASQFLYEASVSLLRRRKDRLVRYEAVCTYGATGHKLHTAVPGDVVHVTGTWAGSGGNALVLSNAALYVLSISRTLGDGIITCTLELGTSPNAAASYTVPTLDSIVADMAWSKKHFALGV